ncbi:hypothetical protein PROFUN_06585 [Planoprotostelium fungivorum]|uniref:Secreted protein n=1 Tax=Planoprotostelium fungivorum TaxID=1890364 RepID=A0A2P6MRZ7_9EUKA|nr:hypothetical protein PROFUN_06585 [Planoprotostelium fungivorum]
MIKSLAVAIFLFAAIAVAVPKDPSGVYTRGDCKCSRILGRSCDPYFDNTYNSVSDNGTLAMTPTNPDKYVTTTGTIDLNTGNMTMDASGRGACKGFWDDQQNAAVLDCAPNFIPRVSCHVVFLCTAGPCTGQVSTTESSSSDDSIPTGK